MLEDLHRVLRLERTNGTPEQIHVHVVNLPEMHAAVSPPLLFLPAVEALEFAHFGVGRVAFQVNVPPFRVLEPVRTALDCAAVDGTLQQQVLQVLQREVKDLGFVDVRNQSRLAFLLLQLVILHHVHLHLVDGREGSVTEAAHVHNSRVLALVVVKDVVGWIWNAWSFVELGEMGQQGFRCL